MIRRRYALLILIGFFNITADSTLAAEGCNPTEDGDCCVADADCVPYVTKTLCAIIPLNRLQAEEIEKTSLEIPSACSAEQRELLKKEANERVVRCVEAGCRFDPSATESK